MAVVGAVHNIGNGQTVLLTAADAREKLHPDGEKLQLDFDETIHSFIDQVEEATCQSVEEADPPHLRSRILNILYDLQGHVESFAHSDLLPVPDSPTLQEPDVLKPMITQLSSLVPLIMDSYETRLQVLNMIGHIGFVIGRVSQNCWDLEFIRSQLTKFMKKSHEILENIGKIVFDGLTKRIRSLTEDLPDKRTCVTKIVDAFKHCCYLELETEEKDLVITRGAKQPTTTVVVRIIGSWEIAHVKREEKTIEQFMQNVLEKGGSLLPGLESVLRDLQEQSTSRKHQRKDEDSHAELAHSKRLMPYSETSSGSEEEPPALPPRQPSKNSGRRPVTIATDFVYTGVNSVPSITVSPPRKAVLGDGIDLVRCTREELEAMHQDAYAHDVMDKTSLKRFSTSCPHLEAEELFENNTQPTYTQFVRHSKDARSTRAHYSQQSSDRTTDNLGFPHHHAECKYDQQMYGMCSNRQLLLILNCVCKSREPPVQEFHNSAVHEHYQRIHDERRGIYFLMKVCDCHVV